VVVNQRKETAKDGKSVSKPLPDAELKQISDLVKEAMGFNKDRGDTISVANAPFTAIEKDDGVPLWRDPETLSLAKELVKYGVIAAIIAYLLLGVVRPLMRTMVGPPATEKTIGSQIDIRAEEEGEEEGSGEHVPTASELLERQLAAVRAIAQQDPQAVANIIKQWTGANAG